MSNTNWTKEQTAAIMNRNTNLLLSAAAGSGKTAVLVQRILTLITDTTQPIDITDLLVLTFTKAAATEMRTRITSELLRLLENAEQSIQKNLNLSQERAQSVASYLLGCGVSNSQIKSVEGLGQADPIGNNDTAEGRQQNRRVEVYMYASQQMIQQAEAGTLK